jgi:OOP family OmpA-OmpF porin
MNTKGEVVMTKVKNAALALISVAALSAPSISMAQSTMDSMKRSVTGPESGWLVGGSVGQAKAKDACSGISGAGVSCDDTDTAFRVFGGYQINRHFGVELGYADLGKAEATGPGGSASVKSKAFDLVAVGTLPVAQNFSVYGKLGFYRADTDGTGPGGSASETNTDLTYAIGVGYDFNKNLGIRGEWQQYSKVGGGAIGDSNIDVMSIGVVYRFK